MATSFALLNRVSADTIEPAVLQKLRAFAEAHDSLVVVDPRGGAPAVQRQSLEGFLHEYFPGSFATAALGRFRREEGSHLTDNQSLQRVDWARLAEHGAPIALPSDSDLDTAGLGHRPDHGQIENWLTLHHGALMQSASRLTREQVSALVDQISSSSAASGSAITDEASAGDFWNCLVRHLGVWGALAVFSALGAALIILTGTGPIGLPLTIWLIGTFGGGTAVIILNCALNPFSPL
jgi:hypothetical protein